MIESVLSFFAVGAIGFFLFLLLVTIVFTASVESDKYGFAVATTILGVIIYHQELFALRHRWELVGICLLLYAVAGAAWSVYRWFKYCKKVVAENPYEKRPNYSVKITPQEHYGPLLNVSRHKSRITGWILFWPWSLLWNITGDFLTGIYDFLKEIYVKIAAKAIEKSIGVAISNEHMNEIDPKHPKYEK